ncbi:DinB family protein [Actinomycetospora termitidis]|uniref:DinB family protein n=1 Tax=Actinomycetospora termitidis TaxID=3053470 RepID=A0ABT7MH19_9PSEU|nr:DinB family protein [Actinomycetospora sp. Odt1-22]MDL5159983.1 DinB family protein [Actinomycetospora sp. Odt1-22]
MAGPDAKSTLHRYLAQARDAVLWKLEGLGEYDVRRPMTPTGTNLLGLVKHLAIVESGYFGVVFDRPFPETEHWFEEHTEPEADLWAAAEESREGIVDLYTRAAAHSDATIDALDLDAAGRVPHWPAERAEVTLQQILVHMTAETHRHAGHADIVRELLDGAAGLRRDHSNLGNLAAAQRQGHVARLEREARRATQASRG